MTHTEPQNADNTAEKAKPGIMKIQTLLLPLSIVIAGLFLGGGILGASIIKNQGGSRAVDATDLLTEMARDVGVERRSFASCLTNETHMQRIIEDESEVLETGTPYSVLMSEGMPNVSFAGAFPPAMVEPLIDALLADDRTALEAAVVQINGEAGGEVVSIEEVGSVRPVNDADHIRGSRDAGVLLVEYSDLQCPFCQRFHGSVQNLMQTYGSDIAWVYRHHPLDQLHPFAREMALASECVAEQEGEEAFWTYVDTLFMRQGEFSEAI